MIKKKCKNDHANTIPEIIIDAFASVLHDDHFEIRASMMNMLQNLVGHSCIFMNDQIIPKIILLTQESLYLPLSNNNKDNNSISSFHKFKKQCRKVIGEVLKVGLEGCNLSLLSDDWLNTFSISPDPDEINLLSELVISEPWKLVCENSEYTAYRLVKILRIFSYFLGRSDR